MILVSVLSFSMEAMYLLKSLRDRASSARGRMGAHSLRAMPMLGMGEQREMTAVWSLTWNYSK